MPLFFWLSFSFARGSQASSTEFPFLWGLTSVFFPVPGKPRKNIKGVTITLKGSFLEQREQEKKKEMKQSGDRSSCPFLSINALVFLFFSAPSEGQLG